MVFYYSKVSTRFRLEEFIFLFLQHNNHYAGVEFNFLLNDYKSKIEMIKLKMFVNINYHIFNLL